MKETPLERTLSQWVRTPDREKAESTLVRLGSNYSSIENPTYKIGVSDEAADPFFRLITQPLLVNQQMDGKKNDPISAHLSFKSADHLVSLHQQAFLMAYQGKKQRIVSGLPMKSLMSLDDDVGNFSLLGHQNSRGLVIFPFQLMGVSYVGSSILRIKRSIPAIKY